MVIGLPVQVDAGIDVGALLDQTISECGLLHKDLYLTCGIDASQWTKAIRGQAPLDLWRLRDYPGVEFWALFLRKFAGALVEHWFRTKHVEVRMARASLREHEERRRA